jgi:hypothetical protein
MKKFIKFILVVGVIGGLVFGGLKLLDVMTYDYISVVDKAMNKFYASAQKEDLAPIAVLLDEYSEDLQKVDDIQSNVNDHVEQWISYLKDKFLCNSTNANACSVQLAEFENLQTKIEILSSVESDFGDKVLTASSYEKRLAEIEKNIKAAKAIVDSKTSTSPKSEIEMQKEKCATLGATSCDKCSQTGVCNCVYKHSNGQKEELTCYKPELATK